MKQYNKFFYYIFCAGFLFGCDDPNTLKPKLSEIELKQDKKESCSYCLSHSSSLAVGDMDNDKDLDIIVLDSFTRIHYLENLGKGRFEDKGVIGGNYNDLSDIPRIIIGDIDQDGRPDIIMTDRQTKASYMEPAVQKKK